MEWNNLLEQLNYYLANLYITDVDNRHKQALFIKAGFVAFGLKWDETPVLMWFHMLKFAADRNKVDKLLEQIMKPEEGNSDDEFLKGAVQNLKENKDTFVKQMPDNEWKGGEIKAEIREKIIGKRSNLLPIGFLEKGTEKSKAIVRIVNGNKLGSGFIIKDGWLVTNHHVLPDRASAQQASIEFGYQFSRDLRSSEKNVTEIRPQRVASLDPGAENEKRFFTDEKLDVTAVRLKENDLNDFGFLDLSKDGVRADDFVNIIQHPLGGPKQIGIYNNLVMYADEDIVQYLTDTDEGSSGSPVLNSDWEVVALHHSGGWVTDPRTKQQVRRNQGTNIKRVAEFIDAKLNGA